MRFGSVCSGIEAASLAWEPLGWQPVWFAEIEKFPSTVLATRWPTVPNLGDMCFLPYYLRSGMIEAPDILVGGTPCQAFSVAGRRQGLIDPRGMLTIKFVEIADAIDEQRPDDECTVCWENVPGVLSDKSNAFGCFLAELVGEDCPLEPPGGKWSNAGLVLGPKRSAGWRILDAQYFGVAQRRRRVFVVASARAGFNPAEILFESEGMRRDSAPSREKGEEVTGTIETSTHDWSQNEVGSGLITTQYGPLVGSLTARHDSSPCADILAFHHNAMPDQMNFDPHTAASLTCSQQAAVMEPFTLAIRGRGDSHQLEYRQDGTSNALLTPNGGRGGTGVGAIATGYSIRRLTPTECERLQGMPDGHTAIPGAADGPRYKSIGNSKAVPVVRWLGRRIGAALCKL